MDGRKKLLAKRIISLVSAAAVLVILGFVTYFFTVKLKEIRSAQEFKDYIGSFGAFGVLVGMGLQILQVFIALIPGEAVEIGLGFAFGAIGGTLICYGGLFIASSLVFLLVKKFGTKFIELFISADEINNLKIMKKIVGNPEKLRRITFLLFFIPGTPKDLITYFFGLTPMKYSEFMIISMTARIPSVISSTIGGNLIAGKRYAAAAVLFVLTALISFAGWLWYDRKINKKEEKSR